jgi:outer membrane protein with beta-barrel domain
MRGKERVLALVGVACLVSGSVGAQTFDAGVKGGIAVTSVPLAGEVFDQVTEQTSRDSSSKVGITGGAYVAFPFAARLSFQPEVLYVMKGVNLSQTAGGTFSARLHYLDVPLLVRFRAPVNSQKPVYLFGGPNFGMKLGSSATLESEGNEVDEDIEPALKTLDLGFAVGGGMEFGRYMIEARFTGGLTDIAAASYPHPDSLHNRAFSVMVGLKLH